MASTGTGVVIGSHSLKVVQFRKKGGVPRLTRVANLKIDPAMADRPLDGKKKEHIRTLLAGIGIKPGECMAGLTGRDLIIRYTHVPPVPDWRLDMLMKFEIEEVSEQSGGEVSADWARLDIDPNVSGENTILVALAKNASLLPRMEILKQAKLRIRGACPNSVGMFHSFVSTAKIPSGEVTLLMHVGAENTDIAIQQDGKLLFARNVSGGGRLFTEAIMQKFNVRYDRAEKMKFQKADVTPRSAAKYADSMAEKVSNTVLGITGQFVSMVHSSVMFCKAQTKMKELSVDRVVLAGGGANLAGFADYLAQNLGIPVEIFDPLKAADASGLTPEEQVVVDEDGTGLAVAFGLATLCADAEAFRIEILPEEYRKKRNFVERDAWMIGAAALTALLIAILFYTSSRDQGAARLAHKKLQSQLSVYREDEQAFQSAADELRTLQAKWVALRDAVRVGPALQDGAALVDRVIFENEFRALHVSKIRTGTDYVAPPRKESDGDEDDWDASGEEPEKVLMVKVEFTAEIQDIGGNPNNVYSDFMKALTAAAADVPGLVVTSPGLERRSFDFTLAYPPASDPVADEEETDG